MAKRTKRVAVESSDRFYGTGVHAPSYVKGRTSSAQTTAAALEGFLRVGGQAAYLEAGRRADADKLRSDEATQAGLTQEELDKMEETAAFVNQANATLNASRSIIDATTDMEWYQTEFDKNLSTLDLVEALNERDRGRMANASKAQSRAYFPRKTKANGRILAAHKLYEEKATHDKLVLAQGTLLQDLFKQSGGNPTPEDWNAWRTQTGEQPGAATQLGVDEANEIAVRAMDQYSHDDESEVIYDAPFAEKLRSNPKYKDEIDASYTKARNARIEKNEQISIAQQGLALSQMDQLADAGDLSLLDMIPAASRPNKNGVVLLETEVQIKALYNRLWAGVANQTMPALNASLWADGNGRMLANDAERDQAASDQTQLFRDQTGADDAQTQAYSIGLSVVNDYVPMSLKSELEINPQNPAFLGAVALYEQFETQQPNFIGKHIASDTVRDILTYQRELVATGSQQKALEKIGNTDWSFVKNTPETVRAEAGIEVMDELDGFLWFKGVKDSPRMRGMIKDEVNYFISKGYTIPQVITASVASLDPKSGRTTLVAGHLYRNDEGWGANAIESARVAEIIMTKYAAERQVYGWYEPEGKSAPDSDQVSMTPIPHKYGSVLIAVTGDLAGLSTMTERTIESMFAEVAEDDKEIELASQAATADAVTEKAKANLTPFVGTRTLSPMSLASIFEPTREWAFQKREDNGNKLTPAQQQLLKRRVRN